VRLAAFLATARLAAARANAVGLAPSPRFATRMRATAVMPIAAVAVAATSAVAVYLTAATTTVMGLGTIAIDIAVRAFAAFEQAFLSGARSAIATATAAATTTAATTPARALTALTVGAFSTRSAAAHLAFTLGAARFASTGGSESNRCDVARGRGLRSQCRSGSC